MALVSSTVVGGGRGRERENPSTRAIKEVNLKEIVVDRIKEKRKGGGRGAETKGWRDQREGRGRQGKKSRREGSLCM